MCVFHCVVKECWGGRSSRTGGGSIWSKAGWAEVFLHVSNCMLGEKIDEERIYCMCMRLSRWVNRACVYFLTCTLYEAQASCAIFNVCGVDVVSDFYSS